MLSTTITTEELRHLTGYSKAQLVELEQAGIIKRDAKNTWPTIETVAAIVARLRERGRRPADDDRTRFEKLRADRERVKLLKETGALASTKEFDECVNQVAFSVLNRLSPLPAQIGGQDLKLRRLVEAKLKIAQQGMSDDMMKLADQLTGGKNGGKGRGAGHKGTDGAALR